MHARACLLRLAEAVDVPCGQAAPGGHVPLLIICCCRMASVSVYLYAEEALLINPIWQWAVGVYWALSTVATVSSGE